ncbi:Tripeptide aminopeptidase [Mannheimia varigena USDA-ARS-USMARC-1388]|uniref:peptidase T n=1 Tax=Mannheimia varigena TaxID=85404 RepID=UPI0003E3AB61|nr:peptidase T [Mannheimia varigena]AHG80264.1 Tripeptide aminopeptidase [Mannheimia varigena USDA-ARS-USMARC-1388]
MKQALLNRLLRYTQIYTTSDPKSQSVPSSPQQWDLLNLLKAEVESMGLTEIFLDPNGYLFATLPANTDISIPVLGLIAHVDTSPDFNGKNVKPQVIECYQGGDILLSGSGDKLSPNDFPNLNKLIGDTLVTTDGTTLLGADDKSGIAIILSAIEYLQANPQISHGKIRIGFTTDEEIGRGADHFDVKAFGADVAFTLDGGPLGELQYENFNADAAVVTFFGRSVHPGTAKGKMINALERACEFQNCLPPHLTPATSEHREGFIMMHDIEGGVDKAEVRYILRSFEREELATFGKMLTDTIAEMQKIYGENCGKVEIIEQYRNMREVLDGYPYLIEIAEKVMREQGIEPNLEPIRGGTDGSRLSFMGLPCPNLFTGGENFHGRFEFISVDTMEKAATVVVGISTGFTKHQF